MAGSKPASKKLTMLTVGTKLGRYEVSSQLGAGGMGEVYLAEDTRLHRKVALKVLPDEVASNRDRMRRFEQEATAAAALNHPNIAHIYEVGAAEGVNFIAMEFIDGETLRAVISRGQTDLPKLLRYLQHTADGLAKAHAAGIVHRDLKPDNVMITRDGHVKILDFGLAKLIEPLAQKLDHKQSDEALSSMPTAVMPQHSQPGTVLGTAGYMSPEQAQGRVKEIDQRSDVFSFGCILFETITGRRAFGGNDAVDLLHNIVHAPTPQIRDLNPAAPDELQKIVRRCLSKDPEERYQSIKDVAIELKEIRREFADHGAIHTTASPISAGTKPSGEVGTLQMPSAISGTLPPTSVSTRPSSAEYIISGIRSHKASATLVFAALVVVVLATGYLLYRFTNHRQHAISFQSAKFTRLTNTGNAAAAAISPDGKWLVHVVDDGEKQSLWLQQVEISNSNTQISPPAEVHYWGLAFSPDGNYVYYSVSEKNSSTGTLYQVPVLGGTARKLLTGIDSSVAFSPDGKRMAFFSHYEGEDRLMIANVDGTGERQLAARHGDEFFYNQFLSRVSWSPDGKTLASPVGNLTENYMSLVAVAVETGEMKFFTTQKWQTMDQVAWLNDGSGLLVTAQELGSDVFTYNIWQVSYPSGEAQKLTTDLSSYRNLSLTSDGSFLTVVQTEVNANIWVMPAFDATKATQITHGTNLNGPHSWTPDGKLVYASNAGGTFDLYSIDPRGGNPKQLTANSGANGFPSVTPDGRYIVFVSLRTGTPHIWRMDLDGENAKQLTDRYDVTPSVSPDGHWVIYSNNTNKLTAWKVSIDGGEPAQISDKFSFYPVVSPDGKEIACYYIDQPNAPVKLAILPFEGGAPLKTLDLPNVDPSTASRLCWTSDGRSIVYQITRGGVTNLWAQPIDGDPPKQLTNFTSDRIFFFDLSRDGKQISLSRGTVTRDVVLIGNFK